MATPPASLPHTTTTELPPAAPPAAAAASAPQRISQETIAAIAATAATTTASSSDSAIDDSPIIPRPGDAAAADSSAAADANGPLTPLSRPRIGTRKSSGTLIVPRDAPNVELKQGEEVFDEDDARAMSPRRNSEDLEKMSQEARAQLSQHAKLLHESLLEIFHRIEAVKEEHDKLDSNNKFLQKYIGDLMSTSKITATGAGNRKK